MPSPDGRLNGKANGAGLANWQRYCADVLRAGRIAILLAALALVACDLPNPSGLTKAEAVAVLRARGYTYPTIGPSPDGWSGYAVVYGYQTNLTVGKNGVVTLKPYARGSCITM